MAKIVTNRCYGGFRLSEAGVREYARRKGMEIWVEDSGHGFNEYWTVPPENRPESQDNFGSWSMEKRQASNEAHKAAKIYEREIPRDDPDLIATVEALGSEASGRFADLQITEIQDGIAWQIEEYDGREWVAEAHATW